MSPSRFHRVCDRVTEGVLYFMVVFGPWAFGTTQPWSTRVLNAAGFVLGALLVCKWIVRRFQGYRSPRWGDLGAGDAARRPRDDFAVALAILTALILGYCLVSAVNARAQYTHVARHFEYLDCIKFLPHSYDREFTWRAFWQYLALACAFWAARDWLLTPTREERAALAAPDARGASGETGARPTPERPSPGHAALPERLRRLLWVLCVNAALLAIVGTLQRLSGTNKLLWLIVPHINVEADAQFGPYAYRSNAAQYFNLIWPVCLGFWWLSHREHTRARRHGRRLGGDPHVVLLPCAVLIAAAPVISTSRGGALVAAGSLLIAAVLMILANRGRHWLAQVGVLTTFVVIVGFAGNLGWEKLEPRLRTAFRDNLSNRPEIYRNARQIADDFPWFGTGPNSLVAVYQLYRADPGQLWHAYVHNDWLETRATFGRIGLALIVAALGLTLSRQFFLRRLPVHWLFRSLVLLALGGCLLHAIFDFPFQVYSVLFLFVIVCAISFSVTRES